MDWMNKAACVGADPELFYHRDNTAETLKAKKICASCPVQGECLEFDLSHDLQWGTWGGVGEERRREMKRKQQDTLARTALRSAS